MGADKMSTFGEDTVTLAQRDRITSGGSKGNQPKWYKSGVWYKADFLGCEGLAEYICSCLLKASNIRSFVEYAPIRIIEAESGRNYLGCKSYDFGTIVSGDVILLQLPEKFNVWLNPTDLATDLATFCSGVAQIFGVDIIEDMKVMMQFDLIVGNEDRILRNFGLRQAGDQFEFAPLFDHGLSLLSDITSPDRAISIEEIRYHPFGYARDNGNGLNELEIEPILINMDRFDREINKVAVYPQETVDRALGVLRQSLEETEGKLWANQR